MTSILGRSNPKPEEAFTGARKGHRLGRRCAIVAVCAASVDWQLVTGVHSRELQEDAATTNEVEDVVTIDEVDANCSLSEVCNGVDAGSALDPALYHARADAAMAALLLHYWSQGLNYLQESSSSTNAAGYWIFAEAYELLLEQVARTRGQ